MMMQRIAADMTTVRTAATMEMTTMGVTKRVARGEASGDMANAREAPDRRLLSEERLRAIVAQARGYLRPDTRLYMRFTAGWYGELRWARNRVNLASDRRDVEVTIG